MGHFLAALLGKLCADEAKAWLPRVAERITDCAVGCLPKNLRERYSEEWRSHLDQVPGPLTKVWVAAGFLRAATQTSSRIGALLLFLYFLPLIAPMRFIFYLNERGMYAFPLTLVDDRVEHMEIQMRGYLESRGYSPSQRVRVEAWVKSREIPLARLLHESLNLGLPLSRIYSREFHYAFWRPSLLYSISEYLHANSLSQLLTLRFVMSGAMSLRDWCESAIGQDRSDEDAIRVKLDSEKKRMNVLAKSRRKLD